jgi:signal transduction histidine kinase
VDHLQRFTSQLRSRLFILLLLNNALLIVNWWIAEHLLELAGWWMLAALLVAPVFTLTVLPWLSTKYFVQPTRLIWQAILHLAPDSTDIPAPDLKKIGFGRELVTTLVTHVYQLAHVVDTIERTNNARPTDLRSNFVANNLPLPLIVLDKFENVLFANELMLSYIGRTNEETRGQSFYSVLDISFMGGKTLDVWLQDAKAHKVTAAETWERVKLNPGEGKPARMFDIAAYYNKGNPEGLETMVVFFDRTRQYSQDEQAMSFIALAVHELRTPLTLLRGYIEVFEEELTGKIDEELTGFLRKMKASAQQLTAFTNNILNVSRYENDQLVLKLHEEKLEDIINASANDMKLRAGIQGITLKTNIAAGLPTVGADRTSIYEVINNLLDNAIKYSGSGKEILIAAYLNKEGLVETTVQDHGVGIQDNALPKLFNKFYRNHRNRAQIGGTGMGLYLSKAIIDAHDGELWVNSKEGQGSTFGFSLKPYAQLAAKEKTGDNKDIVRTTHGWIKNHSLYRR